MEEDSDMAYGMMRHTWFQRQAFGESQKEEKEEEENEFLLQFDFADPVQYRYERYRKLDKITVLGALYKKSLFNDYNIRFNEKQTYYSDPLVVTAVLKYAKTINQYVIGLIQTLQEF